MLPYFQEEQRFKQWWIYLAPAFLFVLSAFVTFQQLIYDQPVGNNPIPNGEIWILWVFTLGTFWLVWAVQLITVIDQAGIHVRLKPFTKASFSWDQIEKVYLRKYKPLREYGGYGLRYGGKYGKAYNISGDEGIQLELKNGKKVLIGTRRWADVDKVLKMAEERDIRR